MGKDLIEDKLYQLKDQFNERKINHKDFYFALLDHINPFYDGSGRCCKMLLYFQLGLWFFRKTSEKLSHFSSFYSLNLIIKLG